MSFAITGAAQEFQLSISRAPKQGDGMWCLSLVLSLVLDRHAAEQSLETFCCLQYSVPLTMPSIDVYILLFIIHMHVNTHTQYIIYIYHICITMCIYLYTYGNIYIYTRPYLQGVHSNLCVVLCCSIVVQCSVLYGTV